jgi:hypothetical protein
MGRPKKNPIDGEVKQPDYALAKRIVTQDIEPANRTQKSAMQEAGIGWKAVRNDAHVGKAGFATAHKVSKMEDVEKQKWLRDFNAGCKQFGVEFFADISDKAAGVNSETMSVVPTGVRPVPEPMFED